MVTFAQSHQIQSNIYHILQITFAVHISLPSYIYFGHLPFRMLRFRIHLVKWLNCCILFWYNLFDEPTNETIQFDYIFFLFFFSIFHLDETYHLVDKYVGCYPKKKIYIFQNINSTKGSNCIVGDWFVYVYIHFHGYKEKQTSIAVKVE